MRKILLALTSAALLSACGAGTENATDSAPDSSAFPNMAGASYRLEANVHHTDGTTIPVVMVRDGAKMRMEFSTAQGSSTVIADATTGESYVIAQMGGESIAMRAPADGSGFQDPTADWQAELAQTATRTGECSAAGQTGEQWTKTEDGVVKTVCVTDDGVLLGATEDGRTVWETTSVERGPQPADQFALPPGVRVMDLGNMGGMMEAIERARDK